VVRINGNLWLVRIWFDDKSFNDERFQSQVAIVSRFVFNSNFDIEDQQLDN
jgi:hypothetical protein